MATAKTATGTTARKSTTAKSTTSKPAAPKPAAKKTVAAAKPTLVVSAPTPVMTRVPAPPVGAVLAAAASAGTNANPNETRASNGLKVRDLVDQVVEKTGAKKKGLKDLIEATLACMGDALSKGEDLNLPPLGKIKINRQVDKENGEMIVLKLHRNAGKPSAPKATKEALADDEE